MGGFSAKVAQLVDASTRGGGVFLSDPRGVRNSGPDQLVWTQCEQAAG
jgi:hypothetical protein